MMGSPLRWLLYIIYGLILVVVLLFVRFPTGQFVDFLEAKVESAFPGSTCRLTGLNHRFPFRFTLDRVLISQAKDSGEMVAIENMLLQPRLSGFGLKYQTSGAVGGGNFSADLDLSPRAGTFSFTDIQLREVRLDQLGSLTETLRREMNGLLEWKGSYSGSWEDPQQRSSRGVVAVREGTFGLLQPVLALDNLDMQLLESEYTLKGERLVLTTGVFQGSQLQVQFSGNMRTAENLPLWDLKLSGSMVVQRSYLLAKPEIQRVVRRLQKLYRKNALPFAVSGQLGDPRFAFGNG